jgi:FkbM family methyltransferase
MQLNFLKKAMDLGYCDVLDIGANRGQSCMALIEGTNGVRYFGFEPVPFLFLEFADYLQRLKGYEVYPVQRAISSDDGFCDIHYSKVQAFSQAATIMTDLSGSERMGDGVEKISVECETLDSFCKRHKIAPRIIKIDTEGAEYKVISGGMTTISTFSPTMYLECGLGKSGSLRNVGYVRDLELAGYEISIADFMMFEGKWLKGHDLGKGNILFSCSFADLVRLNEQERHFVVNLCAIRRSFRRSLSVENSIETIPLANALNFYSTNIKSLTNNSQ